MKSIFKKGVIMDKDTLKAIKIINGILEDLTIVVGCEDIYNLLGWKNRITTKRQDLCKIINDNDND